MEHGWIQILEAAYDLSGGLDRWIHRLLEAARPVFGPERIPSAQLFRLRAASVEILSSAALGPDRYVELPLATIETAPPAALDLVYRNPRTAGTMSELVWSRLPEGRDRFTEATQGEFQDALGIVAHSGTGMGLAMNVALESPRAMTAVERRRWTQVASHVSAGLRLRTRLTRRDPEAVLDPEGRMLDAAEAAGGSDAREFLRAAVQRVERARATRGKGDESGAMALWEALIAGRWSLVDRFESDGKRFVLALRNDPEVGDPRGLSLRERQVAELAGLGHGLKESAYAMGLSSSAIGNAERRAREKLGLRSRSELAAFFAPGGLRRRLEELELEGEPLLVASAPLVAEALLARLTDAEREVALLAVQGATNAAIAQRRGTSDRTVANQLAAVFEKLGVHSRAELAAALLRAAPPSS